MPARVYASEVSELDLPQKIEPVSMRPAWTEAALEVIQGTERPRLHSKVCGVGQVPEGAEKVAMAAAEAAITSLNPEAPAEGLRDCVEHHGSEIEKALYGQIEKLRSQEDGEVSLVSPRMPHPALEIVRLGLNMEKFQTAHRILRYKREGEEIKGKIESLLKLKGELQRIARKDLSSYELSDGAKGLVSALRGQGIDIFPGSAGSVSKSEMEGARSLIGSRIEELRTELQSLFSTKISVAIQFLNSMIDVMKKVTDYEGRFAQTVTRNQRSN